MKTVDLRNPKKFMLKYDFNWRFDLILGMVSGVIGGCACGMIVWLYLSSREEGGLAAEYFVKNTGKVLPHPIFYLI